MQDPTPVSPGGSFSPRRILIATGLFTLVMAGLAYGAFRLAGWPFERPEWAALLFLAVGSAALLLWQERAMYLDPQGFMRRFVIGLALKMVAALFAVALILFLFPREHGVRLALTFALFYLAFLVFTTSRLSRESRRLPRPTGP